jgi:NADH:ubiquinone oxidoreductase subunit F (NADH-binding)/(2Fe-2S) ferredoxin
MASGGPKVKEALEGELNKHGLADEYDVVATGCHGFCAEGPIMTVYPEGIFYEKLKADDIPKLVEEQLLKGRPVEKHLYKDSKGRRVPAIKEIPFFSSQVLRVLGNKGLIDPEKIDDFIAMGGYMGAAKALTEMAPKEIVSEVKNSGIRGRGGAGFPTGLKWELCSMVPSEQKYMLCNGDEGDPGVAKDRNIMEAHPHAVLEGMIIGARAIGASKGFIYVRAEYPLSIHRLQLAIDQAREYGLLGEDILGSGFDFDVEIFPGGGAFVCGESTALMLSIEGRRGMPRPTPPNPVFKGLWDKPTVLNNVETLATLSHIIMNGADWYKEYGTEISTGTRVFTLTGSINNVGLIEVPMGMTLKEMIDDIGGGVKRGRKFKAIQLGGPSGGCIPADLGDTPVTFEDIEKTGVMVGSGGVVVMDDLSCMVSVDKFFLDFSVEESCGKCPPCRIGTKVMQEKLIDITEGRGEPGDIELLEELSEEIKDTALCGLGKWAPTPVVLSIRYFRDELEAHIHDKYCKAGVCKDLVTFYINEETCKGCGACKRACPSDAISGEKKKPHVIDQEKCLKCRSCLEKCKFGSVLTGPAGMREELMNKQAVEA